MCASTTARRARGRRASWAHRWCASASRSPTASSACSAIQAARRWASSSRGSGNLGRACAAPIACSASSSASAAGASRPPARWRRTWASRSAPSTATCATWSSPACRSWARRAWATRCRAGTTCRRSCSTRRRSRRWSWAPAWCRAGPIRSCAPPPATCWPRSRPCSLPRCASACRRHRSSPPACACRARWPPSWAACAPPCASGARSASATSTRAGRGAHAPSGRWGSSSGARAGRWRAIASCARTSATSAPTGSPRWRFWRRGSSTSQAARSATSSTTTRTKTNLAERVATVFHSGTSVYGTTLLLDVGEEDGHLLLGQAQVRHAHALVLREKFHGDGIALGEHLVRLGDVASHPAVVPPRHHVHQVRTDPVALAHGVAGGAPGLEQVRPAVDLRQLAQVGVASGRLVGLPAEEIANGGGEEARVVHRGVPHPLAGRLVAHHQAGHVAVPIRRVRQRGQAELPVEELDVLFLAGEEQPAGPDVELLRVRLQHLGRVVLGIDADRVEEDVRAHPIAQEPLHLGQLRGLERAAGAAVRVDQVDRDRLALE